MKKVEAFVRPDKLEDIKEALKSKEINGMSISQVMGFGKQKGWKEVIRGSEVDFNYQHKIKIELFLLDDILDEVVECLKVNAFTGEIGDGKIFISSIDTAIRIRTDEQGEEVLG